MIIEICVVAGVIGVIYMALSPRFATPLYSSLIFIPEPYPVGNYDVKSVAGISRDDFFFYSKNGCRLHGWMFRHPKASKTVLFHHGNAGNLTSRLSSIELLLKAGVSVFIYDYQGYGQSEGQPSTKNILEDGLAAFDHLLQETCPEQIIHYGESLGGAVACHLGSRQECSGIIVQSSFASLKRIGSKVLPWIRLYPSWLFPQPELDNLAALVQVQAPLLIIHGLKDEVVPYTHAQELYARAKDPKILITLPDTGHNNIAMTDPERFIQAIKNFLSLTSTG